MSVIKPKNTKTNQPESSAQEFELPESFQRGRLPKEFERILREVVESDVDLRTLNMPTNRGISSDAEGDKVLGKTIFQWWTVDLQAEKELIDLIQAVYSRYLLLHRRRFCERERDKCLYALRKIFLIALAPMYLAHSGIACPAMPIAAHAMIKQIYPESELRDFEILCETIGAVRLVRMQEERRISVRPDFPRWSWQDVKDACRSSFRKNCARLASLGRPTGETEDSFMNHLWIQIAIMTVMFAWFVVLLPVAPPIAFACACISVFFGFRVMWQMFRMVAYFTGLLKTAAGMAGWIVAAVSVVGLAITAFRMRRSKQCEACSLRNLQRCSGTHSCQQEAYILQPEAATRRGEPTAMDGVFRPLGYAFMSLGALLFPWVGLMEAGRIAQAGDKIGNSIHKLPILIGVLSEMISGFLHGKRNSKYYVIKREVFAGTEYPIMYRGTTGWNVRALTVRPPGFEIYKMEANEYWQSNAKLEVGQEKYRLKKIRSGSEQFKEDSAHGYVFIDKDFQSRIKFKGLWNEKDNDWDMRLLASRVVGEAKSFVKVFPYKCEVSREESVYRRPTQLLVAYQSQFEANHEIPRKTKEERELSHKIKDAHEEEDDKTQEQVPAVMQKIAETFTDTEEEDTSDVDEQFRAGVEEALSESKRTVEEHRDQIKDKQSIEQLDHTIALKQQFADVCQHWLQTEYAREVVSSGIPWHEQKNAIIKQAKAAGVGKGKDKDPIDDSCYELIANVQTCNWLAWKGLYPKGKLVENLPQVMQRLEHPWLQQYEKEQQVKQDQEQEKMKAMVEDRERSKRWETDHKVLLRSRKLWEPNRFRPDLILDMEEQAEAIAYIESVWDSLSPKEQAKTVVFLTKAKEDQARAMDVTTTEGCRSESDLDTDEQEVTDPDSDQASSGDDAFLNANPTRRQYYDAVAQNVDQMSEDARMEEVRRNVTQSDHHPVIDEAIQRGIEMYYDREDVWEDFSAATQRVQATTIVPSSEVDAVIDRLANIMGHEGKTYRRKSNSQRRRLNAAKRVIREKTKQEILAEAYEARLKALQSVMQEEGWTDTVRSVKDDVVKGARKIGECLHERSKQGCKWIMKYKLYTFIAAVILVAVLYWLIKKAFLSKKQYESLTLWYGKDEFEIPKGAAIKYKDAIRWYHGEPLEQLFPGIKPGEKLQARWNKDNKVVYTTGDLVVKSVDFVPEVTQWNKEYEAAKKVGQHIRERKSQKIARKRRETGRTNRDMEKLNQDPQHTLNTIEEALQIVSKQEECVHAKDCPKGMFSATDASKICNVACGGHHCIHWRECQPEKEKQAECYHSKYCAVYDQNLPIGAAYHDCDHKCDNSWCLHHGSCKQTIQVIWPEDPKEEECIHTPTCPKGLCTSLVRTCKEGCDGKDCRCFPDCVVLDMPHPETAPISEREKHERLMALQEHEIAQLQEKTNSIIAPPRVFDASELSYEQWYSLQMERWTPIQHGLNYMRVIAVPQLTNAGYPEEVGIGAGHVYGNFLVCPRHFKGTEKDPLVRKDASIKLRSCGNVIDAPMHHLPEPIVPDGKLGRKDIMLIPLNPQTQNIARVRVWPGGVKPGMHFREAFLFTIDPQSLQQSMERLGGVTVSADGDLLYDADTKPGVCGGLIMAHDTSGVLYTLGFHNLGAKYKNISRQAQGVGYTKELLDWIDSLKSSGSSLFRNGGLHVSQPSASILANATCNSAPLPGVLNLSAIGRSLLSPPASHSQN